MTKTEKSWDSLSNGHSPRIWLILENKHLLIRWELIDKIQATEDFLEISFDCEYGHIRIAHTESLQQLFEELQLERVRLIDGRKLAIKLHSGS